MILVWILPVNNSEQELKARAQKCEVHLLNEGGAVGRSDIGSTIQHRSAPETPYALGMFVKGCSSWHSVE